MLRIDRTVSAMVIAATLAACGGGGSGGGAPAPEPIGPPVNTSPAGTITGSATKGTIKNGVVVLSQFNSSGGLVQIGTGTTNASGDYSVSYTGYAGGPVQACVRAKTSAEATATPPATTIVCDATDGPECGSTGQAAGSASGDNAPANGIYDTGEELPAPSDFEICTCLPGPPVNGIRAPITPFTDLVVRRAQQRDADAALGEDALTALLRAASEVNQLVGGLDVLRQEPIDLANPDEVAGASPNELVYSALLAAVLGTAVDGAGTTPVNLTAAITALRNEAGAGSISLGALRELIAEAQEQLLGATGSSADNSGVLSTLGAQADACAAQSGCNSFNPEPSNNATSNGIGRAKNLIANVRNTLNGLNDLQTPGEAFGNQAEMAGYLLDPPDIQNSNGTTTPVLGPADDLFEGLTRVVGAAAFCVEDNTAQDVNGNLTTTSAETCGSGYALKKTYPADRNVEIADHQATFGAFPAAITVTSGQVSVGVTGADADFRVNSLTVGFSNNPAFATTNPLSASLSGGVETTDQFGLRLTINTGTATLRKTGDVALDDNNDVTDDGKRISSGEFAFSVTLAQKAVNPNADADPNTAGVQPQTGGPVSFTGALGATVVRCTKQSCVTRENLTPTPNGDPDDGRASFFPSAFNWAGTFSNSENSTAMSLTVAVANAASFDAESEDENGDAVTADDFPQATVTLQFDADLGTVAPARAVITGTLNGIFEQPETNCSSCPAGSDYSDPNATASLTLLRGAPLAQVLRIHGNTVDDGNFTGVHATVTDSNNAALFLDFQDDGASPENGPNQDGDVDGTLQVDGVRVGELRKLSTGVVIIRYDDGTFETLF